MRKSNLSIPTSAASPSSSDAQWLDLEEIARVELSSEDSQYPFENALRGSEKDGWKAAHAGPQIIRLHFDQPQSIRRIRLQFREDKVERSQEFALSAISSDNSRKGVVRQQWNFSPGHSAIENEDYTVDLPGISVLELEIDPGRHDKLAVATLQSIAISA